MYQSVAGTKDAVLGAVSSFLGNWMGQMGQMVSSGMGLALSSSENWVDQNLPLTERELGQ